MNDYNELKEILTKALKKFKSEDKELIERDVHEVSICHRISMYIEEYIRKFEKYKGYYSDIEYNKNVYNKDCMKKIIDSGSMRCDLIVHSRGKLEKDNLLCLEMKKGTNCNGHDNDKHRISKMTQITNYSNREIITDYIIGAFVIVNNYEHVFTCELYYNSKCIEKIKI